MTVVRDVVIRFVADTKDLARGGASLDQINARIKKFESDFLTANQKIQTSNKATTQSFANMQGGLQQLGAQIGITFSIGTIVAFGKAALDSFKQAEESARKLSFAVTKIANGTSGDLDLLLKQSAKLQDQGIFSDEQIQSAQTALLTIGLTVDEVNKLVPAIADAAALNGEFDGTLQKVIMGVNGSNKGLKQMGIFLGDVKGQSERVNEITRLMSEQFSGGLTDALNTAAGASKNLENRWDDMLEKMGALINDGIVAMKSSITDLTSGFDEFGESADGTVSGINQLIKSFIEYSTLGIVSFEGSTINAIKAQKEFKAALDETVESLGGTVQDRLLALRIEWDNLQQSVSQGQIGLDEYNAKYKTIVSELVTITNDASKKVQPIPPDCDEECQAEKLKKAKELYEKFLELEKEQLEQIEDLRIAMMEEGFEKERALIELNFKRALADVEGNTQTANLLRLTLEEKYQNDLKLLQQKYDEIDAENREKEAEELIKQREKDLEQEEKDLEEGFELLKKWKEKELAYKTEVANAENELEQAKMDAVIAGADALRNLTRDNAQLSKVFFLFRQAVAVGDILRNLEIEIAGYASNPAWTALPDGGATLKTAAITKAKIRAGIAIGTIAAQVVPELAGFADGVIDLKRGPHPVGRDTIPAMLDEGESVMTRDETRRHKDLFLAIRNKELEKFIHEKFVLPELNMQLGYKWLGASQQSGPNKVILDERKLAKAMPKNISVNNIDELAKALTREQRRAKMFARRGVN